jgi:hypothetical protein
LAAAGNSLVSLGIDALLRESAVHYNMVQGRWGTRLAPSMAAAVTDFIFDAFSSREPVPTSLENATF